MGVVIEEDRPGAFLTEHPDDIYARNGSAKVPYICTRLLDEVPLTLESVERVQRFYGRIRPNSGRSTETLFRSLAPVTLEYKLTTDNPDGITDQIIDFYMKTDGHQRLDNISAIGKVGYVDVNVNT